jgi:hypothetical protein
VTRTKSPISRLVRSLVTQARELKRELLASHADHGLSQARDSLATDLAREVLEDEAADVLAQATVCAAAILAQRIDPKAIGWLRGSLSVWEQWSIDRGMARSQSSDSPFRVPSSEFSADATPAHLYDEFLHRYAPTSRRRHGVFFTPQPISEFIVRQIDAALIDDFNLPAGLASRSALRAPQSALAFLDPACGTGVFLLALIDHLHHWLGEGWNDFVPDLLPRLIGIELLPVPAFLAKLNIAAKLAATGYDFRDPGKIDIRLGDTLSPNLQSAIRNPQSTIPILLGNPPFSSLSTNTNPWIARLVRGDDDIRGYVQSGDERLGERKTWLHDDYVKFLRLAQWHVEEAGCGIVGFVTNRGYLDNATFRLMRRELMRVFAHIRLVDLHGSRKGGDVSPNGDPDENVFGLDQGIAIGLFSRPPLPTRSVSEGRLEARSVSEEQSEARSVSEGVSGVEYVELWGTRKDKLQALAHWKGQAQGALPFGSIAPRSPIASPSLTRRATIDSPSLTLRATIALVPPHWRFVPTTTSPHPEYAAAWSLDDAMPVHTTAPVTARDHFVVAFTRTELEQRIAEFRDLSIPDEVIRRRYFTRTRSSRYPRGDTRSWKLAEARRIVAADDEWHSKVVGCLYRPFDWRYVFWHPAMIDWPRTEVTRHFVGSKFEVQGSRLGTTWNLEPGTWNLCLIARRQQLPSQPCTYFWISDGLALDGVIRSDNRGSESLFPLWKTAEAAEANFSTGFIEQFASCVGLQPEPENVLAYIYALFHSPTYRERYAAELRSDFPRILLPGSDKLFESLDIIGHQLMELHLLRTKKGSGVNCEGDPPTWEAVAAIDSRPPDSRPHNFRVGGYDVLRKWLQPKHRSAGDPEYQRMVAAIEETISLTSRIDEAIAEHGGFPAAFTPARSSPTPLPRPGGALPAAPAWPSSRTSTT